jgi:dihydroneopterin aldolase
MSLRGTVELRDLRLGVQIGTFLPGEPAPDFHLLDLGLTINADLLLIAEDCMTQVFDYDPLLRDIELLSQNCHYETQERLLTLIVKACALYPQIEALEVALRKGPVRVVQGAIGSGTLGIRLVVDVEAWSRLRVDLAALN